MNPVLTLDHVSYSYHTPSGETPALKDVSFSVRPGSFTSIAGPSGCGKSTLLSLIAGLITPEKGCIRFYKSDAMPAAARIGYMLQHTEFFFIEVRPECITKIKLRISTLP